MFRSLSCTIRSGLAAALLLAGLCNGASAEDILREQQTVAVDGQPEIWQLVWDGQPETVCGPDEVYMAITCPCSGLAYGEAGKLSLRRLRDGQEIDHLDLGAFFGRFDGPSFPSGLSSVQRWPTDDKDFDREENGDPDLVAEIKRRPAPVIMKFADYDRDGAATEFLLQAGTLPCGKLQFLALGVSKENPKLHALTTSTHPDRPLYMLPEAWQALATRPSPSVVPNWSCGDHGNPNREELMVAARDGKIQGKLRTFSCPEDGTPEKLLEEEDW